MNTKFIMTFLVLGMLLGFAPGVFAEEITPTNFNTVDASYQGVNVGWTIAAPGLQNDISQIDEIKVNLYSDGTLLATNTANLELMKELVTEYNILTFSTPFIINDQKYGEDDYWDFEWKVMPTSETKPDKAEIIYKYSPARPGTWAHAPGVEEIVVENTSLAEPVVGGEQVTWNNLEVDAEYIENHMVEEETKTGGGGINVRKRTIDKYGETVANQMFELINEYSGYKAETKFFYWVNQKSLQFVERTSENTWTTITKFDIAEKEA